MIFPVLNFFLSPRRAPVTWLLLYINIIVFFATESPRNQAETVINSYYRDSYFLDSQGAIYAKFITLNPKHYTSLTIEKAKFALSGNKLSQQNMGLYALRDTYFLDNTSKIKVSGDQVAISEWREKIKELRTIQSLHPNNDLGYISSEPSWQNSITYQFLHANRNHLLGNSLFFMLLGSYLEPIIGSAAFLLVFLTSGVIGAQVYSLLGGVSATPMIGASGSVSGIVGLFGTMFWRKPVRFYYFIMPLQGYCGFVYLPAWLILIHRIILDMTGYFSSVEEIGDPIAFTTHLGGLLTGVLLALFIFRRRESTT